jgi:hypothetical protein
MHTPRVVPSSSGEDLPLEGFAVIEEILQTSLSAAGVSTLERRFLTSRI